MLIAWHGLLRCALSDRDVRLDQPAFYQGSGYISVCERVDYPGGIASRYCNPASCDCNIATSAYGIEHLGTLYFYVGNNSSYSHTIDGYLATNF